MSDTNNLLNAFLSEDLSNNENNTPDESTENSKYEPESKSDLSINFNVSYHFYEGDVLEILKSIPDNTYDAMLSDPPYGLSFLNAEWDHGVPSPEVFKEINRVCKSGAFVLAFGGTRKWHRLACSIEDAGIEIRDTIAWIYGSGFPKSYNISKGIDKDAGAEREVIGNNPNHHAVSGVQYEGNYSGGNTGVKYLTKPSTEEVVQWEGYGTSLKPAFEPVLVCQVPKDGTYVNNVLKHGCGGLNIDGSRVGFSEKDDPRINKNYEHKAKAGITESQTKDNSEGEEISLYKKKGRWPANVIHDGSDEVIDLFPHTKSGATKKISQNMMA